MPDTAVPLAVVRLDKVCRHVRKFVEETDGASTMNSPESQGTLYVAATWEGVMGTGDVQRYRVWLEPL